MPNRRPPQPPRRPPARRPTPSGGYGGYGSNGYAPPPGPNPGGTTPRPPRATVINVWLLIFSIVLGFGIWGLSEVLYDVAVDNLTRTLLIGALFFILSIVVTLLIFGFSAITHTLEDNVFNAKPGQISAVLFAVLLSVAVFALGALFQWLYSIDFVAGVSGPTSFVFIMDDSGTMNDNNSGSGLGNDPDGLRYDAIEDVMRKAENRFPYMVYSFNSTVSLVRDMAPKRSSEKIDRPAVGGLTVIRQALEQVIDDYEDGEWDGGSRPHVILLTDGYATDMTSYYEADDILERYSDAGISISTVGLGADLDETLLQRIADRTGGDYVRIDEADELSGALQTASFSLSQRDLLATHVTNRLPVLYSILRILFVSILCFLIGVCATVACGQSRSIKMSIVFSAVTAVLGAVALELGILLDEPMAGRAVLWVLTATTLSTKNVVRAPRHTVGRQPTGAPTYY